MAKQSQDIDLVASNRELETLSPEERIAWAHEIFGIHLVMSSSFGLQSAVLLHMANTAVPGIPVVFVDTGYLFKETYRYVEQLEQKLDLNLKIYTSPITPARQEALSGKLWEKGVEGLEEYGLVRKVEPMSRALQELGATGWLTGLRREQSDSRKDRPFLELQNKTYKLHPIVDWDSSKVITYILKYDLPHHPLFDKGYLTLGDTHSTRKLEEGMSQKDTRYGGFKWECGLHEGGRGDDFAI
ncbi:MAG: phosphoadenylyl-sulfate reductase [Opitutae bacterium]|nr:phosphoadenylyl-sulfate reductase [Opitutae bacterium]